MQLKQARRAPRAHNPIATAELVWQASGPLTIDVHDAVAPLCDAFETMCAQGSASLYQRHEWLDSWSRHAGSASGRTPRIIVGRAGAIVRFILPLATFQRGPYRVASWLSDTHSNFDMGLFDTELAAKLCRADMEALLACLRGLLAPIDVLELCCQPVEWDGTTNPFSLLPWQPSHNHGYALSLEGGFDEALNRRNGSRKRKKFRWQTNKLAAHGGATLRIASTAAEVDELLGKAMQLTAHRFAKAGIGNTFDRPGVVPFFRELAIESLGQTEPAMLVYALDIAGEPRAIFAGGIQGDRFSGCFTAIADDEFTSVSPGEMLIYLVIQDCVSRGLQSFDLGRGEERYKTSWCDQRIAMFETSIPLTRKAIGYAAYERAKLAIKRALRNNPRLWAAGKKLRARFYGRV